MGEYMNAEEKLLEWGFDPEEIVLFENEDYDTADRAVYDFDLMIEYLMNKYGWSDIESIEWIEANTLPTIPYGYKGRPAPIVIYRFPEFE